MKWRKVPGYSKWVGYADGKHCATFQQDPRGHTRAWVDAGRGFQELLNIKEEPSGVASWKRFCEYALTELRRRQTALQQEAKCE